MTNRIQCVLCHQFFSPSAAAIHIAACRRHCGWSNRQTWNVALWLSNEASSYEHWRNVARICRNTERNECGTDRSANVLLAAHLRGAYEDAVEHVIADQPSVFSDLLRAALSEVDWLEIAENLLED